MSAPRVAIVDDELFKTRGITDHFDDGEVDIHVFRSVEALERELEREPAPYDLAVIDFMLAPSGQSSPYTGLRAMNTLRRHFGTDEPRYVAHTNPANRDRRLFLVAAHRWYDAHLLLPDTAESRIAVRSMVFDPAYDVTAGTWRLRLKQASPLMDALLAAKTPARSPLQWLQAIAIYDGHARSVTTALGVPQRAYAEAVRRLYPLVGDFARVMSTPVEQQLWHATDSADDGQDARVATFARMHALILSSGDLDEAARLVRRR